MRAAVRRLHPSLIRASLQASLRSLADQFEGSFEFKLHLGTLGAGEEALWRTALPEDIRLAIYRVAEEALNNVMKHAAATKVDLSLGHPAEDRVTMTVRDNGRGFDVETVTPGVGVHFMQDYCGAVGGNLELTSAEGQGTTVHASFSLKSHETAAALPDTVDTQHQEPSVPAPALSVETVETQGRNVSNSQDPVINVLVVDDLLDYRKVSRVPGSGVTVEGLDEERPPRHP